MENFEKVCEKFFLIENAIDAKIAESCSNFIAW